MGIKERIAKIEKNMEQRVASQGSGGPDRSEIMTFPFGFSKIFVLPEFEGADSHNHEVWVHFGFTDGQGRNRVYLCSKTLHGSCPICDQAEKFKETDEKRYNDIRGVRTYIYNVLNENWENRILCAKPSQMEAIDSEIVSTFKLDNIDVSDFTNGRQLNIERTKATPWCRARVINAPVNFPPDQIGVVRSKMKDLTKFYRDFTPVELTKMMNGKDIYGLDEDKKKTPTIQPSVNVPLNTPVTQPVTPVTQPVEEVNVQNMSPEEIMKKLRSK